MKAIYCHLAALALSAILASYLFFIVGLSLAWAGVFSAGFLFLVDGGLHMLAISTGQADYERLAWRLGYGFAALVLGLFSLASAGIVYWLRWLATS
jgi:hypothetical protein